MNKEHLERFLIGTLKRSFDLRDLLRSISRKRALIPQASTMFGSLFAVIAIMAFLASVTAIVAIHVANVSEGWQESVSQEITVQIRPLQGTPFEAEIKKAADLLRGTPGFQDIYVSSKAESEKLLEQWLGDGLDFDQLPVPRMITAQIDKKSPANIDALRRALTEEVKGASLDDHRAWTERLSVIGRSLLLVTLTIFGLVIAAGGFAVAFATRSVMTSNREIIEVLHFVGASESYIARQFQSHFFWIGIKGGMTGVVASLTLFLMLYIMVKGSVSSPGGAEMVAIFGSFSLNLTAVIVIISIGALMALVTALVSRLTAHRTIRGFG